jgi:hypothetical protein
MKKCPILLLKLVYLTEIIYTLRLPRMKYCKTSLLRTHKGPKNKLVLINEVPILNMVCP